MGCWHGMLCVWLQISNLVFKYQHADVLCSVALESLSYSSASPDTWTPQFQQPHGDRKTMAKVCWYCGHKNRISL